MVNEAPVIRSDGTFKRDYLYVEDAAEAYLVLAEENKKSIGEAFNFGWGIPLAVLDLVNKIISISGKKVISPKILNQAAREIKDQYLSSKKAEDVLGWKPKFTIEGGLKKTYAWYEEFLKK